MVVTPLSLGSQLAGAGAAPLLILFHRTKSQSDEPCSERASQSATARETWIVATCNQVQFKFRHWLLCPPQPDSLSVQPR